VEERQTEQLSDPDFETHWAVTLKSTGKKELRVQATVAMADREESL
jgi:hypothetical protein